MASSTFPSPYLSATLSLYAPNAPTDISTDTTVSLDYAFNKFKWVLFYFLSTSSASSTRSFLCIPSSFIGQGAWWAIAQGNTIGGVRISYPSDYTKIRFISMSSSLSSLYVYRIWGMN